MPALITKAGDEYQVLLAANCGHCIREGTLYYKSLKLDVLQKPYYPARNMRISPHVRPKDKAALEELGYSLSTSSAA